MDPLWIFRRGFRTEGDRGNRFAASSTRGCEARPLDRQPGPGWDWLGLIARDVIALRIVVPAAAVGMAIVATVRSFGLLPSTGLPFWAKIAVAVVAMDLAIYLQHILFHESYRTVAFYREPALDLAAWDVRS